MKKMNLALERQGLKMSSLFIFLLIGIVILIISIIFFMFKGKIIYDKLNAVLVMNTLIVIAILVIGFVHGRLESYIDIALSYSLLGFITTAILAKYIGGRR